MGEKRPKSNGRSRDLTLAWLTRDHGQQWEEWRVLMAGWIAIQDQGTALKLGSMTFLAMHYLPKLPNGHQPTFYFMPQSMGRYPILQACFLIALPKSSVCRITLLTSLIG